MNSYALPNNSQAWQNTLDKFLPLLPSDTTSKSLSQLPIFAVVVVADRAVVGEQGICIDTLVQEWTASQMNWQINLVSDDEQAIANAHTISTHETLADVVVHRYLLLPIDAKEMTPQKRDAVAHIIDEQLTAHLKKHLKPACRPLQIDDAGQIVDFGVDKTTCVDVHLLSIGQLLETPKLVCFDMDSTLIEQEVIVELAKMCGVSDKVEAITERAMRGEIDFGQSFAERVALLEGVSVDVVDEIIAKHISFQNGAFAVIKALKAHDCHTVLISGGFVPFAEHVAKTLGIDEFYANNLIAYDGKLAGLIDEHIIDGNQKAKIVKTVAHRLGLQLSQVVCVGDGANDLPMMDISNIGVAYRAKPIVQARADVAVNITGLEGVLYALGQKFNKVN